MKPSLLPILFGLLALVGCSKQETSKVSLEISNSFVFGGSETAAVAGGGLMVWGKSASGVTFGQSVENSDAITLDLPNDTWIFYAMSWDGTTNWIVNSIASNFPLGGQVRCSRSPLTSLTGGKVEVTLNLSNANCGDKAFSGNPSPIGAPPSLQMPKLKLRFCDKIEAITGSTDRCTDDLSDPAFKARKAAVSSYRVTLKNHFSPPGQRIMKSGGLTSNCMSFIGDGSENTILSGLSGYEIPSLPAGGGPNAPFHVSVEVFVGDANCDSVTPRGGPIVISLPHGAASAETKSNKYFSIGGLPGKHLQVIRVLPAQVCNGRTGTAMAGNPFAGGVGNQVNPFIICSVPQFHAINNSTGFMASSFKLQANLDFNPYSKGFGGAILPPNFNCLQLGSNFIPIGYASTTCPISGIMNWGSSTPFTGDFLGGGFKLNNLRFRSKGIDRVGLISKIIGSTSLIQDLDLIDPSISGKCYVGGFAGEVSGVNNGNRAVFRNLNLINGKIEASERDSANCIPGSKTGGVAGSLVYADLKRAIVKDTRVSGSLSDLGGAVGMAFSSTLDRVSVEADIVNHGNQTIYNVGGVIGHGDTTELNFVKHEGLVSGHAVGMGGIAGKLTTPVALTKFYAISYVHNLDPQVSSLTGGVVGDWKDGTSFTPLGPGYSLSMVRTACTAACEAGIFKGGTSSGSLTPSSPAALIHLSGTNQHYPSAVSVPNSFNNQQGNSFANFRNGGQFPDLADLNDDDWIHTDNSYPRFDFEKHPCSEPGFSGSGDGVLVQKKICTLDQYLAISAGDNTSKYRLASNIRLENHITPSGTQYEITGFAGTLFGNNKALIGGDRVMTAVDLTGHIGSMSGKIINLRVLGMSRTRTVNVTSNDPGGVLVADNSGTLENLYVHSDVSFLGYGAGLAGKNTGTIKNVTFEGLVKGYNNFAGLVFRNSGTITNSKMRANFLCQTGSCNYISGLVEDNTGTIEKTLMAGKLVDAGGNQSSNTSMLVDTNTGKIEDVLVSDDSYFRPSGTNHFYFTRVNSGDVIRTFNLGWLIHPDNTNNTLLGWPTVNDPSVSNKFVDVYRSGKAGKLLLEQASYFCSSTNTLEIGDWGTFDGATANYWSSGPLAPAYNGPLPKKLMVNFTRNDGTKHLEAVQTVDLANDRFTISTNSCDQSGTVDLFWTEDYNLISSEMMLPQDAYDLANYSGTWNDPNIVWDYSEQADVDAMIAYMKHFFGLLSPQPRATWELDDGRIELFDEKKE